MCAPAQRAHDCVHLREAQEEPMTEREKALDAALRAMLQAVCFNGPPPNIAAADASPDFAYLAQVPLAYVEHAQDVLGLSRVSVGGAGLNPHLPEAYRRKLAGIGAMLTPPARSWMTPKSSPDDKRYGAAQHFRDD
jgi:hypothetical protein